MPDYLKIPEVARRLDVSEKTARRYVKAGTIPSVFVGGAYRVGEEDLAQYLQGARPEPDEPDEAAVGAILEAIYELTEDGWWVVSVPEIPGAHSQGETLEEARMMIKDAVRMLLEVRREDAQRETEGKKNVVREPLEV